MSNEMKSAGCRGGPTPATLRELLDYDPETGLFTWKPRAHPLDFNRRLAGRRAFVTRDAYGYLRGKVFSKTYMAHRVAWAIHYGEWPSDTIDHINGDPADNRITNLRCVPHVENCRNKGLRHDNPAGYCGVRPSRNGAKWEAHIGHDYRSIYLGTFPTKEAAIAARKAAEAALHYHKNHGSRPALTGIAALTDGGRDA